MFSKKNLVTNGRRPLRAASRVLNASFPTASSAFAKCWVHSTNKTSALFKSVRSKGFHRVYSTRPPDPTNTEQPLYRKLLNAWSDTPVTWYPIPIAVGALVLVAIQYRKKARKEVHVDEDGNEVIRLKGPWQVHVLGALPLRNMSRLWGYVNSLELPVWFRPYGFRLYAVAFGCNLDEIEPADLKSYPSLGAFFYRKLKDGARPVADAILVSPADGKILHFGTIQDLRVEQVKGITYSLDALLGVERPGTPPATFAHVDATMPVVDDHEFANVNGIEYSLDQLIGTSGTTTPVSESPPQKFGKQIDASVVTERDLPETIQHDASVAAEMGLKPSLTRSASGTTVKSGHSLFFSVIYLAPGDYHRFHSPTAWVVEKRRHFVGELFSVSPYVAKRLENLFVLNERVALLGRWRHGFFSMIPVGATNVGSIKVNFDQTLRTNVRGKPPPPGTYTEAVYSAASTLLNGQPLTAAQEMGGFCLGSTIVLVFEAPNDFEFAVHAGQKVRVGQKLGDVKKRTRLD
ncbi:Phosphatidylserine decarboxylase proenzyme 1, mitochondrial [Mycena indigotica]|uniref:Phosphatidylserine decarboxylase proenzyme 1, mitochondrial n=1 Tax=Mycena indigotica TaxID=2126181 RepID=A0A8H6W926_9AGAR|nr:Phosphatidylserine decarboxylase proenzyme 1, mitochondrial [Mycena indigotica]KAF7303714.1 Phosphatidylserine decarboxylase proenzyme 1, mitochondrial [Mycena indigotica]